MMNLTSGEDGDNDRETKEEVENHDGETGDLQPKEDTATGLDVVPEETEDEILAISRPTTSERPISQGIRVPSQQGRVRLTRTPALREEDESESETNEHGNKGVLITELQNGEYYDEKAESEIRDVTDEGDEIDREDSMSIGLERGYTEVTIETVDAESERLEAIEENYDTDLENEDSQDDDDLTGKSQYEKICKEFGIVPISYFVRHITDTEITMRFRGLGATASKAIALVLKDSVNLEKLNLQGNWMEGEGGLAMAKMLIENEYILDVNLADNQLGSTGAKHICKMLSVNGGLKKLDLSGNQFIDQDIEYFLDAMETNKYLRELTLSRNKFGEVAGEFLGPAISANDTIDVLDLSWNHFRHKGAVAIARGLKENVRLKRCDLSWNGFGPEGGAAIADALLTNDSLLELNIGGNRLNAESAKMIAKSLVTNDTLKILRMGNNLITTAGAIALATTINNTESCEIVELDLTDVPVEFEFLRIIEDIKMQKPDFKVSYGPVLRSGNTMEDFGKLGIDPYKKKEPVILLKEHIIINDMRLVDMLKRYDPDETFTVSSDDFLSAVEDLAVPYNKQLLQEAVMKLQKDPNGRIYFGDFVKQKEYMNTKQSD